MYEPKFRANALTFQPLQIILKEKMFSALLKIDWKQTSHLLVAQGCLYKVLYPVTA